MTRTIEVEVDAAGRIHPLKSVSKVPPGRAILTWQSVDEAECAQLSEAALGADWLRPEEDAAWAHLQPEK